VRGVGWVVTLLGDGRGIVDRPTVGDREGVVVVVAVVEGRVIRANERGEERDVRFRNARDKCSEGATAAVPLFQ